MEDENITIGEINDLEKPIEELTNNLDESKIAKLFEQARTVNQELDEQVIIDAASQVWGNKSQKSDIEKERER